MLTAITMVSKRFEITVVDSITAAEFQWFEAMIEGEAECALNKNGRILLVEGFETIYDLIAHLSEHEFIHDVGLIREVIDYEPQYEENLIEVEFDNDDV